MVIGVLHRKLLRTIFRSWGQSLAVIAVVVCGSACYITIYSAYLNLRLTRDTYYAQCHFADFEIMLERAPAAAVFKIAEIPGVRHARARIVRDVNVDIEGVDEPRIGRIVSMPNPRAPVLHDIVVTEGRYFEPGAQSEVIVNDRFAEANGLQLGDRIHVSMEDKKYPLRIVGLGLSAEYVYMIRNVQELVPSPERFGILWVPTDFAETALDMRAACNNILGDVDRPEELDLILDQAEKLLKPFGVFAKVKREDQISNRFLSDEIHGLGVSARIIPTLFLGVAALILLVLLNRMVRMERTQIGLLKAYGYSDWTVAFHYVEYALILAVAGCLGGFALGARLSVGILRLYVDFYQFPLLEFRVYPDVLTWAMGLSIGFAVAGATFAAVRAARIHPAESMRPEAPRFAHRIWLERFPRLWRAVGFTWKMILRNIGRNAFRASLNIFGVAVSTGLLIMGFFTMDAMYYGMEYQFNEVQREDVKISFQGERGRDALYDMQRFRHVRYAEPLLEYPFEVRAGWRKKDIIVIGLPQEAQLLKLMTFRRGEISIPERGVILGDYLAGELGVVPGDRILMKPLMGRVTREREVVVHGITEQFLGTTAYMDLHALSRILDEPFAMNAALLRIEKGAEQAVNRAFKDIAGIASVGFREKAYQSLLDTLAESMRIMNVTLLAFAGVIAFSIIYNVTSVSLAERQRELASLRVLGFTAGETGSILYYENFLLGVIGMAFGIPVGMFLSRLLVRAYESDLYRLPFHIDQTTYVISIALTTGFVALANWAVRRKIHGLDLVEVLKERE